MRESVTTTRVKDPWDMSESVTTREDESPPPRARLRLTSPHRGYPRPLRDLNRALRVLGPGLVTGAADDDPSGIGTYSQAGAAFGSGLLWMAPLLLPLAIAVQEMCGRIGIVTHHGLAGIIRRHYARPVLYGAVALLCFANTINVGADLGAMAAATNLLVPVPRELLVILFALGILLLEIFVPYRRYAQVLKLLTLSLLAYVLTAFIIQPDWASLLHATFTPQIAWNTGFLSLVVAIYGTTISPYLFFWQASQEVEEVELHHRSLDSADHVRQKRAVGFELKRLRVDTSLGMLAATATFWFIVVTTSSTLHTHGVTDIATADQAARALEPLVRTFPYSGTLAKLLFTLGILGTGLLAIPVLAGASGYAVAETFGWREGLERRFYQAYGFYAVIALATLLGLALPLLHVDPIRALIYAAVLNGAVSVPLLALLLLVGNNKKILGKQVNGWPSNLIGGIALTLATVAVLATVILSVSGH
jgi:NRAMP (natural resistance-associated macrophage protein)-like metal ion transporter